MNAAVDRGSSASALIELGRWLKANAYHFTTVTPATHERVNRRSASALSKDLSDVFGWNRPYLPGILPPECRALMLKAGVEQTEGALCRSTVRASTLDDQLLFHSSFPTRDTDAVFFGPDTYRFVGALRRLLVNAGDMRRVADIGCGSGAGAIVVGLACPGAQVHAVDINPNALRLCEINAAVAGARNVTAQKSDLFADLPGEFDLIIANPPYMMDPSGRAYRDGGGERGDGLSKAIVEEALQRLCAGGRLILYTGVAIVGGRDLFRNWTADRLRSEPVTWRYEEIDPDVFGEELDRVEYADVDRIAAIVLEMNRAD